MNKYHIQIYLNLKHALQQYNCTLYWILYVLLVVLVGLKETHSCFTLISSVCLILLFIIIRFIIYSSYSLLLFYCDSRNKLTTVETWAILQYIDIYFISFLLYIGWFKCLMSQCDDQMILLYIIYHINSILLTSKSDSNTSSLTLQKQKLKGVSMSDVLFKY